MQKRRKLITILIVTNNLDEVVKLQVKQVIEENREESKNQILNFTNINNKNSY